jgi:hypothetical protein
MFTPPWRCAALCRGRQHSRLETKKGIPNHVTPSSFLMTAGVVPSQPNHPARSSTAARRLLLANGPGAFTYPWHTLVLFMFFMGRGAGRTEQPSSRGAGFRSGARCPKSKAAQGALVSIGTQRPGQRGARRSNSHPKAMPETQGRTGRQHLNRRTAFELVKAHGAWASIGTQRLKSKGAQGARTAIGAPRPNSRGRTAPEFASCTQCPKSGGAPGARISIGARRPKARRRTAPEFAGAHSA